MKKKILITGCSGFLAKNLINYLLKKNKYNLYGLSKKKLNFTKKIKHLNCDITNLKKLRSVLANKYDIIINFAGNINHNNSSQNYKVHYLGVKNLLEASKENRPDLFIQIGSSLEYGKIKCPHREGAICKPKSSYGKAKHLASKIIQENLKKYIILRPYQVYGPHQKTNRLVPKVIESCLRGIPFKCTTGEQRRDFLYVEDFTRLIGKLIEKKNFLSGIYNIGSGVPVTVKKIILLINNIIKKGKPLFGYIKMRKEEDNILYPNIKKIKNEFKWTPKISLHNGLKKTIKFYEKKKIN